jgi:hypothetical protein
MNYKNISSDHNPYEVAITLAGKKTYDGMAYLKW